MNTEQFTEPNDALKNTEHYLKVSCRNMHITDPGLIEEIVKEGSFHFEQDPLTKTLNPVSGLHLSFSGFMDHKISTYDPVKSFIQDEGYKEEKYIKQLEAFAKAGDMVSYRALRAQYLAK